MNVRASGWMPAYRFPPLAWVLLVVGLLAAIAAFHSGLADMLETWQTRPEYSHGMIVPLIAAYLAWQRREVLSRLEYDGAWSGLWLIAFGLIACILGRFATIYVFQQCGFVLVLYGLCLALGGRRLLAALRGPLLILLLMVPLPAFFLHNLSAQLQLLSSQIGVWVIRLFGISVFVEGNVIDLGGYKLQVAEACDGLRYLFPLLTLSFLMAWLFKAAWWKRLLLFVSAIPITILMNSFRIGTIGVMVEHWGTAMAEGFLHDFQGWVVFMASAAVLLLEMMLLSRVGKDSRPWREAFGLDVPTQAVAAHEGPRVDGAVPAPLVAGTAMLVAFAAATLLMPERSDAVPQRESFASFPGHVERWSGRRSALEQIYLDALKLDDYVIADYVRDDRELVNLYVAWYDSQRAGESAHSPRSCLPGGGWQITKLDRIDIPGASVGAAQLRVNRVQIELGNQKQLVYYWFQQRGRVITNEYLVKWYLLWDSLTRHRTDGALVRLVTPLRIGEQEETANARLAEFAADIAPQLNRYIPD